MSNPSIGQLDKRAIFICVLIFLGAVAIQPKLLEFSSRWAGSRAKSYHSPSRTPDIAPVSSNNGQTTPPAKQDQWSKEAVASAFRRYGGMAAAESTKMRQSYARLGAESAAMGDAIGYPAKLDMMDDSEMVNAGVAKAIADRAIQAHHLDSVDVLANKQGSIFRVREAFQHYMRDWSEEGRSERTVVFEPILTLLRDLDGSEERGSKRVLVPGSGLGRIAWEISELGYNSSACEYSQYMNMAFQYLLDPTTTPTPLAHQVYPWAHRFSHQRTTQSAFRSIDFPDALPRISDRFRLIEGDFFQVKPLSGTLGYDYIITVFFIDTSHDIAKTLRHIHALLAPGGRWINLGPLLWAGGGSVAMELSLEEVKRMARMSGFEMDEGITQDGQVDEKRRPRTVSCEYTGEKYGMYKRIYEAEFWSMVKKK